MTNTRALLLLLVGALSLALATVDDLVIGALVAAGFEADAVAPLTIWLSPALAAGGFVLVLVGLVAWLGSTAAENRLRPYARALTPLAAEFGRAVRQSGDLLELELLREGQRVEIQLDPRAGGGVRVRSSPPSRQSLRWLRPDAEPKGVAAAWREVERGPHWQLRAELPAMARPLLADPALMQVVDRFFAASHGLSIAHTVSGMVIDASLVTPEEVDAQVRLGVEIAFRLRRVNG